MDKITRKAQIVIGQRQVLRQNKFLLLQTNQQRGLFWQNCTGAIDEGESYQQGAQREVMEETGLRAENIAAVIDLGLEHCFSDRWGREVCERSYLILVKEIWQVVIDPAEHQDFKWINESELELGSVKYPGNFEALVRAIELLKAQP